jgi:hypothetical protein
MHVSMEGTCGGTTTEVDLEGVFEVYVGECFGGTNGVVYRNDRTGM